MNEKNSTNFSPAKETFLWCSLGGIVCSAASHPSPKRRERNLRVAKPYTRPSFWRLFLKYFQRSAQRKTSQGTVPVEDDTADRELFWINIRKTLKALNR